MLSADVARRCGINVRQVSRLVERGELTPLTGRRRGAPMVFDREQVERYAERLRQRRLQRGDLTPELLDLMEHEKVIEQGLMTYIEVGVALAAIRDGRKYLAAGYTSDDEETT